MQHLKILETLNHSQLRKLYNNEVSELQTLKSIPTAMLQKAVAGIQMTEEHALPLLLEMEYNSLFNEVIKNKDITPYEAFVLGTMVYKRVKEEMLRQINLQKK